jgi:hypothetical protein
MALSSRLLLLAAFVLGLSLGAGGALALGGRKPAPVVRERPPEPPPNDDDHDEELLAANASLVRSLQACNRKLSEAGARQVEAPAAPPPSASASGPNRRRNRQREPLSREDWERFAEEGVVPYRIPCLRDTPYRPSSRDIERLGLAPEDAEALSQAYARSNERVAAQIKPLCGAALGSIEVAERIGPGACMKAILDGARRESPEKMKAALTNVAEVNAGKRAAPDAQARPSAVEALLLGLTAEAQKFEADLAASFGPEEARRIANARGGCSEQGVASADSARRGGRGRP